MPSGEYSQSMNLARRSLFLAFEPMAMKVLPSPSGWKPGVYTSMSCSGASMKPMPLFWLSVLFMRGLPSQDQMDMSTLPLVTFVESVSQFCVVDSGSTRPIVSHLLKNSIILS